MSQAFTDPSAPPPSEIHRADPAEQRRTFLLSLLVAAAGSLLLLAILHELDDIRAQVASGAAQLATDRFMWMARASFLMLALTGLVTGGLIARAALAVIREQRYPHQGARLLRDQRIVRGQKAVLYGRLGVLLAAAFAVVGCIGAWMGWRLLAAFS